MTPEILSDLIRANLAMSAAIVLVLALRLPVRRWLGARAGYQLWLIPAIAVLAIALPPRMIIVQAPAATPLTAIAATPAAVVAPTPGPQAAPPPPTLQAAPDKRSSSWPQARTLLLVGWLIGTSLCLAYFLRNHRRFLALAKNGQAGPAAVGVIRPRVVLPADFETRFGRAERAAILAHEQTHLAAQHPRTNAVVALIQAVNWFNPLIHLAAHLMRIDQELACDAAVVEARPKLRGLYAQTLLKTQLAATPLPLGCYWPPRSEHPLTMRVQMLSRSAPGPRRRLIGGAVIALAATATGAAVWAAQPAKPVTMMTRTQWYVESKDGEAHTPAGQVAFLAAMNRAHDLAPKWAAQYAKLSRWNVEHDERPANFMMFALLDRAGKQWPLPAASSDKSTVSLAGALTPKDGRRVMFDLPASFGMLNNRADPDDDHAEMAQVTKAAGGVSVLTAVGLADGRMLFAPATTFRDGEEKRITMDNGETLVLKAQIRAAPAGLAKPTRVKSMTLNHTTDGTEVIADRTEISGDGRTLTFTGHVSVRQGEHLFLADRVAQHLTATQVQDTLTRNKASVVVAQRQVEQARQQFAAGQISQRQLDDSERALRHAQNDLRMVKPSAAPPEPPAAALDDKAQALATGDWRRAAALGANAGEVMRALQAKGRFGGANPDEAVVTIAADGRIDVTPMKPLPLLGKPGEEPRSANLGGTGFAFSAARDTIILYPSDARTFEPARTNTAPAVAPTLHPPGWRPFAAVFDGNAPVVIKGKVTSVEWVRPRIQVHMVDTATSQAWKVEGGDPDVAAAAGMTREVLARGAEISVRGYQSKDKTCAPECLANGRDITLVDGRKLFVGVAAATPHASPALAVTPARAEARAAVIRSAQADLDLARRAYDEANRRFVAGLITSLDLQDFKRDVAAAEARLAVAKAN